MSGETNPIKYNSATFASILADLNSDPEIADKPPWIKRVFAGVGAVLSKWNNAIANQAFLRTAFTRQVVADHLAQIDYYLAPHNTSSGTIRFNFADGVSFPVSFTRDLLKALFPGSPAQKALQFESRTNETYNLVSDTFTANDVTDIITTATNLDLPTGTKVRLETTGTLPGGLSVGFYWLIRITANTYKLAVTITNAYNGIAIDITSVGVGVHTIKQWAGFAQLYQQRTVAEYSVGKSDGTTPFQEFSVRDADALSETITVEINSQMWTQVDSLIDSTSSDKHFRVMYKTNNVAYLRFGDGVYGAIPPANFDILVNYAVGGRVTSNIGQIARITAYNGGDANIQDAYNTTTFSGGIDPESMKLAKELGPLELRANRRFVTTLDGRVLAQRFGSIAQANVERNYYGLLSCRVPIIPFGGGMPSPALKTALQDYLIARTQLESVDVRVVDPAFLTVNFTSQVKLKTGYLWANVLPFYELGVKLVFSEKTYELLLYYEEKAPIDTINYLNALFGTAFSIGDWSKIVKLLDNVKASSFGVAVQESDVIGLLDSYVDGVDFLTTAQVFPIVLAGNEIAQYGTIITTQIP